MSLELIKIGAIIFVPLILILLLYCLVVKSDNKQVYHIFICHVVAAFISIFIFKKTSILTVEYLNSDIINNMLGISGAKSFVTNLFTAGVASETNKYIPTVILLGIVLFELIMSIFGSVGFSTIDKRKSNLAIFSRILLFELSGIVLVSMLISICI